jgi:hypothetical protein
MLCFGVNIFQGGAMALWMAWWAAINLLRPAFSRLRSFMWFVTVVAGLSVRTEHLGVTSIVRAMKLRPALYNRLLKSFHSKAIDIDRLSRLWASAVTKLFPDPVRVNGRRVLVGDGIKVAKCGKKMPGVKLLHQESGNNTKPEYIMGHSLQAVGMLVRAANSVFSVPLAMRIHEGLRWTNRDRRTLLDKMLLLLGVVALEDPYYFVADAFYAAGKMIAGLCATGNHLVTRAKSNAVAWTRHEQTGPRKRGRPTLYGDKIKLKSLFKDGPEQFHSAISPVYGEQDVTIRYRVRDLLLRPSGRLVRFVAVIHPSRGACLLMCTDLALDPVEIIRLYGFRFKIEHGFKQAVHLIGTFGYHFWMMDMKPLLRRNGDQYLHRASLAYRNAVKLKVHAYHVFVQAGVVCQGLLQYLAVTVPSLVWNSFGSWLRTVRPGIPPSELVVANALRQSLPEFLVNAGKTNIFAKFIGERQDLERFELFRLGT